METRLVRHCIIITTIIIIIIILIIIMSFVPHK